MWRELWFDEPTNATEAHSIGTIQHEEQHSALSDDSLTQFPIAEGLPQPIIENALQSAQNGNVVDQRRVSFKNTPTKFSYDNITPEPTPDIHRDKASPPSMLIYPEDLQYDDEYTDNTPTALETLVDDDSLYVGHSIPKRRVVPSPMRDERASTIDKEVSARFESAKKSVKAFFISVLFS